MSKQSSQLACAFPTHPGKERGPESGTNTSKWFRRDVLRIAIPDLGLRPATKLVFFWGVEGFGSFRLWVEVLVSDSRVLGVRG